MSVRKIIQGAGAISTPAAPAPLYVDDVFSTYLYTGAAASQTINNGINLTGISAGGTILHITGNTLFDSAPNANKLNVFGNVAVNTTTKMFGTGSLSFDGAGDYITSDYNSSLNVGSGNFTLEFWMYINVLPTAWKRVFSIMNPAIAVAADEGIIIEISNTNKLAVVITSGSTAYNITDPTIATATTWTHWAMVKSGTTMTLYRGGVSVGSVTIPANTSVNFNSAFRMYLGRWPGDTARDFNGYIDDLRLVVGTAKYTGNFTPPVTALPLDSLASGGGLVWVKARTVGGDNLLVDNIRGANNVLISSSTGAEIANYASITSLTTSGFTLDSTNNSNYNGNILPYVSWSFRKAPKFFDTVTYTGDGTTGRLISHSLGINPGMIIIKSTSTTGDWLVAHRSYGGLSGEVAGYNLTLNTNVGGGSWLISNTGIPASPSTVFKVDNLGANNTGTTYVAYLFAHDTSSTGLIQCGSYTTDASGIASVNLGWEPQFLISKSATGTSNWWIGDIMRGMTADKSTTYLSANTSNAEATSTLYGVTSSGFNAAAQNASQTYMFVAIRRSTKPPTSGNNVFSAQSYTGTSTARSFTGIGFSPDMIYYRDKALDWGSGVGDRLRGSTNLSFENDGAEYSSNTTYTSFDIDGFSIGTGLNAFFNWGSHIGSGCNFKRATGFFDIVCYTGTGTGVNQLHNLGVIPELCIFKTRSVVGDWVVLIRKSDGNYIYGSTLVADKFALNSVNPLTFTSSASGLGLTASNFTTLSLYNTLNAKYIAYFFSSLAGISKVGSYLGNGSTQTINCGFAAGARFIIIKCASSAGDWYSWDYSRGIIGANDPHMSLNSTAAEITTDDSIDPDNSGFIVNQVAATNINVTSATYVYLAIS
jgi:hypothetical protein